MCLFYLGYNSNDQTKVYPIAFNQYVYCLTTQRNGSAYCIQCLNVSLSSCTVHNYQSVVDGYLICFGF